jgi:hypothetical protein
MYTLFTLRANNEGSLIDGNEEKRWGFAQIVAMALLATNVLLLLNGIQGISLLSLQNPRNITYVARLLELASKNQPLASCGSIRSRIQERG